MSDALHFAGGLVLHGPGLLRKPRVGETLVSRRTGKRFVVDHFDTRQPALCHYRDEAGDCGTFIWTFADGELNRVMQHAEGVE